jgi:hypothetical protein
MSTRPDFRPSDAVPPARDSDSRAPARESATGGTAHSAPEPPRAPNVARGTLDTALGTVASAPNAATGGTVSSFSLSSWAVARHTMAVALVVGAIFRLWKIQEVLLLLLLAIIFATAIRPRPPERAPAANHQSGCGEHPCERRRSYRRPAPAAAPKHPAVAAAHDTGTGS